VQVVAPQPPPAPPVAPPPAPLTDQPPIAAPTERVAVTPLQPASETPVTPPAQPSAAAEPNSTTPAEVPPDQGAALPTPAPAVAAAPAAATPVAADPSVLTPQPETAAATPTQPEPALAAAVTMAPIRSAGDPIAPAPQAQTAVLIEPVTLAPDQPGETAEPQTPVYIPAGIPTPSPVPVPEAKPETDPRFAEFVRSFRPRALREGIRGEVYDRAMSGIGPNERVAEALVTQPEFVRPVWDYLATAVSDLRVQGGRERLAANDELFDRLEQEHGVPREVVTAVWAMESNYGRILGSYNLFEALANLAYDGRRQEFGRQQLLAALKITQEEGIDPKLMVSSWAGAFGQTQFIPTTFLERAVDGDGDGVRNLWASHADALASAASYLRRSGWRTGEPWGQEVRLPENFPYAEADPEIRKPQREWAALGVRTITGQDLSATDAETSIFLPAGARGPAFIIGRNFTAILRYNNATSYALAVGLLSDRLKGAEGVIGAWPRDERPLNREQRVALQEGLTALGYSTGNADGVLGRATRLAIRNYQKARGLPADGFATTLLLARITEERARR
jgi:membrane-bound lytic murein transglycosylase B